MQVANITPTAHLQQLLAEETYHLILAKPVIESKAYREFYANRAKRGDFVILDNDAHELKDASQAIKIEMLQRAYDELEGLGGAPSEVVLPDRYGAGMQETIDLALEGAEKLQCMSTYMAVPRGFTLTEYYECAERLWGIPKVSSLGVYYLIEKELATTRAHIARVLYDMLGCDMHFLGESSDLKSMLSKDIHGIVRGIDTAKLVNWGLCNERVTAEYLPEHRGRLGGPYGYFDMKFGYEELWNALENIRYWREYCAS